MVEKHLSAWSMHLIWVEYAHKTHISSATGMSSFEASLGYTPPLFSSLNVDIAVPSVQHHFRRCRRVWRQTKAALLRSVAQNKRFADKLRHHPQGHPQEIGPMFHWAFPYHSHHKPHCC